MAEDIPVVEIRKVRIEYKIDTPLAPPPAPQSDDVEAKVLEVLRKVGLGRAAL